MFATMMFVVGVVALAGVSIGIAFLIREFTGE